MNKYKNPFEFWSYRNVRKEKFPLPKIVKVLEDGSLQKKKIKILLSHHYLIPRDETPKKILDYFKTSLTIENPDFISYEKYGKGFIPKYINPFLEMYMADSKYLGLPRSINFEEIKKAFKKHNIKIEVEDIRPKPELIKLKRRENFDALFYQKEAIDKIINGNVILKLFCGKGKTALTLIAIGKLRYRTLILVRTKLLIKQWVEEIHNVFDIADNDIGIISGDSKLEGKITIATVQSLINKSRSEKRRIAESYGHIVCDEIHEGGALQYYKLLQYFKCHKITGLTATPIRPDGKSRIITCYVGEIVKVDDSGIIPTKFDLVKTKYEYKHDGRRNEYTYMMDDLIINEKRNLLILGKIKQYLKKEKIIFVYSSRIIHLEYLQKRLEEEHPEIKTGLIVYKNSKKQLINVERQELIRQRANKKDIKVVFGTHIIKQGFNVKPLSVGIIATPTKSPILVEQILGRMQREYKAKDEVVIVDFIDEKIKTLLYQFFYKNKKIYKKFREMSDDSRKNLETKKTKVLQS